ncbi:hypothetical protein GJ744_005486 [Endocarpon pusillum]|uniref:Uncharacterized protein n=1 Tax=Endocarpon pusillum TaxID=364733 RepID=A0A8H7A5L0_9EURO|nr:hypothetical protein GJ744_005486 [Endocarpon pusillum]
MISLPNRPEAKSRSGGDLEGINSRLHELTYFGYSTSSCFAHPVVPPVPCLQFTGTGNGLDPDGIHDPNAYGIKAMHRVRTYIKPSAKSSPHLKINITENSVILIAAILASFNTTDVVKIITWSTAYAVFPVPTFEEHKGYMLK